MTNIWFQCPHPNPDAGQRLICFAHAGGSASFYRSWGAGLPNVEVHAVRYPGRGERIDEPLPRDLRLLGTQIAEALLPLADRPLALFGHSLGAPVALETARGLEARGVPVAHLFVSGSRNAPLPPRQPVSDDESDPAVLAAALGGIDGTDPELVADPFFQELVLPYVLADSRMFHAYDNAPEPKLRCPVTSIFGDVDGDADRRPWPELTSGRFEEHVLPGDHFYLSARPPFELIERSLPAVRT
ncbi:oleoyl-ACP hydrolase [Lentzea aerocolonigenes]|uniref:Oleoyl-ACP hydrolase n=1 Tax=Lentzea aerocolonigenes TaxID=68170 RepID=A0A0F0GM64_LENAE|nr:alpha/beta fold hydrolase [Lentzea aerocolonigenes]KJK43666.1 oleoyl-ACP hydrolase [Lentzea aerocolonigenes]